MKNKILIATSFIGALTILLGAFGTHALKERMSEVLFNSFETAVRYQMYHVLALLIVNTTDKISLKFQKRISYLFFTGILLFSGSIYLITIFQIPAKYIWFITPLGGLFLTTGWVALSYRFIKPSKK